MHFNPRSHERSDVRYSVFIGPSVISIHAPTRGATSKAVGCASTKSNFNPRSHERSDSFTTALSMYLTISIHAPTRGATLSFPFSLIYIGISIHAPTRGATGINVVRSRKWTDFNPRSHERSDCFNESITGAR